MVKSILFCIENSEIIEFLYFKKQLLSYLSSVILNSFRKPRGSNLRNLLQDRIKTSKSAILRSTIISHLRSLPSLLRSYITDQWEVQLLNISSLFINVNYVSFVCASCPFTQYYQTSRICNTLTVFTRHFTSVKRRKKVVQRGRFITRRFQLQR